VKIVATIKGHPWDLWGLAHLFDGSDSSNTVVKADKPEGRPSFDPTKPDEVTRFRVHGYDICTTLTCNYLTWDDTKGRPDLRELRPIAEQIVARLNGLARTFDPMFTPVKLLYLSFVHENGAGSLPNGDWTPNKDSTLLGAKGQNDIAKAALALADSNPDVDFVLNAMVLPATWSALYLVFDAISMNVGGQPKLKTFNWLTKDQLNDLKYSANNSRNIREGARHGNRAKTDRSLIPLDQAHILTCTLVVEWLYWLSEQTKGP
jgi:hypothetical protein